MELFRMTAVNELVKRCRMVLQSHYGSRFKGLVFDGSTARNQAEPMSDIDLLVLLSGPLDYFHELRQIIEVLYPLQLESDRLISAKPAALDEFEDGSIQLYRNARKEGLLI